MAFSKNFKTETELENNGVWLGIGFDRDTGVEQEICVRFFGNPETQRELKRKREDYTRNTRNKQVPVEKEEEFLIEVLASSVLIDWRGFLDDDQKPIKFTEKLALNYLTDPEFKEFRAKVIEACSELESFRKWEVEVDSKNSETSSTGKQSGAK